MSDYMHDDLRRGRNYELHGQVDGGTGWGGIIAAAAALGLVLALILFGGVFGSNSGEIDPIDAGVPPAAVPDASVTGETAPAPVPAR
jgi:hypothetical protein